MEETATRGELAITPGLAEAADLVGDRWSMLVIAALLEGPATFGKLLEGLGVAPNVLSKRLKHLEAAGLLVAMPYSRRPPRFRYQLSSAGEELAGPLRHLARWAERRQGGGGLLHGTCGTELEVRWYCSTCEQAVLEGEPEELDYV